MHVDLFEALEHHRRGDLGRAAALYQAALAEDPRHPDALNLLGVIKIQQGDPAASGRSSSAGRPRFARTTRQSTSTWARRIARLGDIDRTIACCQTALSLDPNHADVHRNLALALVSRGDLDAAVDHYRERPSGSGRMSRARTTTSASVLQALGRLEEARDSFLEARRLSPHGPRPMPAWHTCGNNSASSIWRIDSLRDTLQRDPGTPGHWPGWRPGCATSCPQADEAAIEGLLTDQRSRARAPHRNFLSAWPRFTTTAESSTAPPT